MDTSTTKEKKRERKIEREGKNEANKEKYLSI